MTAKLPLVTRLRSGYADCGIEMCREAADEIERHNIDVHSCHADCTMAACVNGRLRAEIEGLRKDAERYRWLRQFPTHFAAEEWGRYGAGLPLDRVFVRTPEGLDAAIDTAMAVPPSAALSEPSASEGPL
jgi:hypothetical protein